MKITLGKVLLLAVISNLPMTAFAPAVSASVEQQVVDENSNSPECRVLVPESDGEAAYWDESACDYAPDWVVPGQPQLEEFCGEWLRQDDFEAAYWDNSACNLAPSWMLMEQHEIDQLCLAKEAPQNCKDLLSVEPGFRVYVQEQIDKRQANRRSGSSNSVCRPSRNWTSVVERWRPLVSQYWPANLVDCALSVIRCESVGDPFADNPSSHAGGLFQFLPTYWPERSEKAGFAGASVYDPVANVGTAAWLQRTGGWGHWECST